MLMRALFAAAFLSGVAVPAAHAAGSAGVGTTAAPANPEKPVRLDRLFAELQIAPTLDDGKAIEGDIIAEWLRSGDSGTDAEMAAAMSQMAAGQLDLALGTLDTIVAARPDYIEGWNKRATVYFYLGEFDKSLADIAMTLKLDPRHFGALSGLGMIEVHLGDRDRALAAFEKAYAADPALDNVKQTIDALKAMGGKDI